MFNTTKKIDAAAFTLRLILFVETVPETHSTLKHCRIECSCLFGLLCIVLACLLA